MQPLTGSEIQQLSMHDVLTRKDRCWCCGGKRKVIVTHMDSKLVEVCIKPSKDDENRFMCPYSIYEYDDDSNCQLYCLTPFTEIGNCRGVVKPTLTVTKFYEAYNDLENFELDERAFKIFHNIHNYIVNTNRGLNDDT